MFDLTTPEGAQDYLSKTPYAASSVVTLEGGHSNFTYRITLHEPYVAPGFDTPVKTLVMKHAEPYIAKWKEMPYSVERQEYECLAFKLVPELVGPSPIVGLPKLFCEERERGVMLMTDSGPESRTLKTVLQCGPLSDKLAHDISTALGTFIARLHASTRNPMPESLAHTTKTAFAMNQQGRSITSSFFYGQVISTLTANPPLTSPPLVLSPETLAKVSVFVHEAQERIKTSNDVLVMGDFWTGNMLTMLEPTPHIMVVDWESARPGFPGIDLGQFLAELHLLSVFHPKSRACVDIMVTAFMGAYRATMLANENLVEAEERLAETAYEAAGRIGVHLITLTPRVPWGGLELTRAVVQEGVEYILRTVDRDESWLRESIVGGLWG